MKISSCAIIGLGAIGGSLCWRLSAKFPGAVKAAAEGERAQRYLQEGFLINGNRWFPEIEPCDGKTEYDLVIIAVKFQQFEQILPYADALVGKHSQVISLLNGIATEEILIGRYGEHRVIHAFTVGQDTIREGNVIRFVQEGKIVLGERDVDPDHLSERVAAVRAFLEEGGNVVEVPEDIEHELWWKLMVNVGINQASAVLLAPYGEFQRPGEAFDLMMSLMREVLLVSEHTGSRLDERDIQRWIALMNTLHPDGKTSMLQDVEARRITEVGLFAGTIVQKAEDLGLSVPCNRDILRRIRALDAGCLRPGESGR